MKIVIDSKNLAPIKDYSAENMKMFMDSWNKTKMVLFLEKDKNYGGSWMKDGILGAYFNLKRKIDRIITRFKTGEMFNLEGDKTNESNIDTFMDLENYSTMNMAFLFFTGDKETYDLFLEKVPALSEQFVWDEEKQRPVSKQQKQ